MTVYFKLVFVLLLAAATNDIWIGLTDQFKEGRMVWYDSHYTLCFEDWWGSMYINLFDIYSEEKV